MNTKNLVLMAMLVAVGAALYLIIPGITGGMKIDFMLTMMFIGVLLFRDVKSVFILTLATGVLSGLLSTFPLAFFPNIIDKLITGFAFYAVIKSFKSISSNMIASTVLVGLGTLLSGFIFLSVAIFILGVDLPFLFLFTTVVLPTVVLNGISFFLIKPIVTKILERSSFHKTVAN
ncbi:tryptophan transporter [Sporosarcina jiandibaonis]|uniref:tryptophan transporter n=1 Tax=Sporosarcina jiandibaonis TaxID=2715535 RepID=UPI0015557BF0|nr:tryptophan transporter [Sporosarcina jiandibaonis]